jgi:hypothetical protein
MKLNGHCYCSSVHFECSGEPIWVSHCHCESCRRHCGAAMASFAGFRPKQVKLRGDPAKFHQTSDGIIRSFCGDCGSPISYQTSDREDEIHLYLGLFDHPEKLTPQDHNFFIEKIDWLQVDDHLPKFDGLSINLEKL